MQIDPTDYRLDPPISRVRVIGGEDEVDHAMRILDEILAWAALHPREEAGGILEVFLKMPTTCFLAGMHTGAGGIHIEEAGGIHIEKAILEVFLKRLCCMSSYGGVGNKGDR